MRATIVGSLAIAALICGCSPKTDKSTAPAGSAPSISAPTMPHPKVGVWETTMTLPHGMTVTSRMCIDEAMASGDKWMRGGGKAEDMPDCTHDYAPTAGGYTFDSVCKLAGGTRTVTTKGMAKGDFNSAYTLTLDSHSDPAPSVGPADTHIVMNARYVGACAPGQASGVISSAIKRD